MFARTIFTLVQAATFAAAAAIPHHATTAQLEARSAPVAPHTAHFKRCGGCGFGGCGCGCTCDCGYGGFGGYGGYGGLGGYGYPFITSVTSDFDRNFNAANFNSNTLYANNVNANAVNDNVHAFNNANVVA
ncbi:hypothetical protein GGI21_002489 [Coemansia aciculifera]|uniref:Uncharacterized protein n=1 Tax=Coemansia aciculifera TaxID=417176 RepID=A0ACC1M7N3_9FUNG|nr:hypothetical protein IWW38_001576 [Coemansia aciculifera]KAJ2908830.1 hypothetical protein GGI21_002489 [Coemansia aciculifera]